MQRKTTDLKNLLFKTLNFPDLKKKKSQQNSHKNKFQNTGVSFDSCN